MKYEEIKVRDVFKSQTDEETVISKSDKYRIITTINSDGEPTPWTEDDLYFLKPIKEELPEEGLLVSEVGSLVYKLSDGSGYGFALGEQSNYVLSKGWNFSYDGLWKQATPEQKASFIEMLKKECEKHGLFEDTKIECHADGSKAFNQGDFGDCHTVEIIYNKNGEIFNRGNFAKPLASTLDQVTDAVKSIADFTIEESPTGLIILTPINK